jgi:hypothetical protein
MSTAEVPLASRNAPDGTESGPDAESGKLFEVPRVKVDVDRADPTLLKIAWSGSVELDRGNGKQVGFYNDLKPGQSMELVVTIHVAGARKVHRRDSEGDVDAIVETKSLVVSDVHLERISEP